ncbi:uncharacterized protein TRAVEDRAFT_61279 [Trametes versicolor FP-101664 SS1]|uniref:uncharacterized protein n=1 Tax=Trametes versicolor (strain FP-101664) TaxID=717944 RepID=UPI0004622B4D|nr:uncharacterized protein TRAVEDRAFT_61279 [Trametes versicolor FP-101664 SS1]EIW52263.1 hypothetical protein TRAVEDRAFT_61279 [Trametes versicolor FP-101664 SS1]
MWLARTYHDANGDASPARVIMHRWRASGAGHLAYESRRHRRRATVGGEESKPVALFDVSSVHTLSARHATLHNSRWRNYMRRQRCPGPLCRSRPRTPSPAVVPSSPYALEMTRPHGACASRPALLVAEPPSSDDVLDRTPA